MSEPTRTDAERLRSAEVALATIREHAERSAELPWSLNDHARGYDRAMRNILRILDARWEPEGAPVVLDSD